MNGIGYLISRPLYNTCVKSNNDVYQVKDTVRPSLICISRDYSTNRSTRNNNMEMISPRSSNLYSQTTSPFLGTTYQLNHRLYSSNPSNRGDNVADSNSSGYEASVTDGFDGNDLVYKVKEALHQTGEQLLDMLIYLSSHMLVYLSSHVINVRTNYLLKHRLRLYSSTASNRVDNVADSNSSGSEASVTDGFDGIDLVYKAKEALYLTGEQLLDMLLYLIGHVMFLVSGSKMILGAWALQPIISISFHKLSTEGPGTLRSDVPYEKSFWGALEVPVRYLITFMAFSHIGVMVAPTTITSQVIGPARKGAFILSLVWFLHRWKTNFISRALVMKTKPVDRDRLLTLDKLSSVGLFVLGGMTSAEACGMAVQSILTVGGIGGVATAFAARDILGNILTGLSLLLSQPFSLGDTIKAGSVEGQVMEIGLMTTTLLSVEQFPIVVPNSLFSSQAIVNKSRAGWRAMDSKILVQIDNISKIPQISEEIENMMKSNANVFLEKEQPYCYLSRIERSAAELSLGCKLKKTSKHKLLLTEQDVLVQSIEIIKKHGATLANT